MEKFAKISRKEQSKEKYKRYESRAATLVVHLWVRARKGVQQ